MTTTQRLALFDLDHTLLPLDSDYQWADFLARTGRAGDPIEAQRRNEELMERYNAGRLTAEQSAEFMLGLLTRGTLRELDEWHEAYMAQVILPAILPSAIALVEQHLGQGDLCAIVTATNEFVTAPIARAFNIPHLIATIPEMHEGRYTGRISGVPSFQAGKITRVQQWLAGMGQTMDDFTSIHFYSDSHNDLPLLEVVSHPIATNPSPVLRELARERGWRVIDLFEDMRDAKS
ncbi:HAD-IB family hydrolase [Pusillimonas sp. TS35]|uniref:HAD family hydrolase n=1 Tax=Paracandidimonas lactea TaxID=2895524 RepID=UPI00136D38E5|nr:HAD family hydrolase [Paracandidimonas lactea]MYN13221.1 HAD-IB family hydrolase [Pusillimonas sp. TS35]